MLAKDEEEMAEAWEVEKRRMHHCSECGKSYKHEHKLRHHKTWLCKERALDQVQSEPRRELSSNFFQLPTIPEGEEVFASERVSKPNDQSEGSEAADSFASERVSKPLVQGDGAVALLCFKCEETFTSKNSFKKHMKRKHKGEQVIRFSDILCISNVT